jgi:heptosyltransferase-2
MNSSRKKGHPRILVLRGGALGDFILTLPALSALRHRWPEAHIEIIGYPRIIVLAKAAGVVDEIQSIDAAQMARYFSVRPDISIEQREYIQSFDLVISYLYDPHGTVRQNLSGAGAPQVIYGPPNPEGMHAVLHLLKPLEELAIFAEGNEYPELRIDPGAIEGFIVPEQIAGGAALAIHPGSGSKSKNWPPEKFVELADGFDRETDLSPVLVFGEAEADTIAEVEQQGVTHMLLRDLSLLHYAKVLLNCAGYVGNDSGATHLASELGLPVTAIFGPTDPGIWGPRHPQSRIIRSSPPTAEGLRKLQVKEVFEKSAEQLNLKPHIQHGKPCR